MFFPQIPQRDGQIKRLIKAGMKLLGAKLRGIFAKFSEALSPSFAKATEGSPHLHPRSKLRGIRRRRIKLILLASNNNEEVQDICRQKCYSQDVAGSSRCTATQAST